jgi:tetratricopeptide (TPR) repeat protein
MSVMSIFLSHASADHTLAQRMVSTLRGAGADVWFAERHLGAQQDAQQDTQQALQEIQRELAARPIFIVLLSPAAFASDWVRDECRWACNIQKRDPTHALLPVVIAQIEPSAFNSMRYLETYKRVAVSGYRPLGEGHLLAETLRLLALTPGGLTPIPVAPDPAESVDDLLTQGAALAAQQRWVEALSFFQRAAERDPRHATAWGAIGRMLTQLRRYDEALLAAEQSLALNDRQAWVWYYKGNALVLLQRYEQALVAYDRALVIDPDYADVWYNAGLSLEELTRYEEALAAFTQALEISPNDADAWSGKGNALHGLTRYEEALAAYDQALVLDPTFAMAAGNRALSLRALGRVAEAEAAERRAKELASPPILTPTPAKSHDM